MRQTITLSEDEIFELAIKHALEEHGLAEGGHYHMEWKTEMREGELCVDLNITTVGEAT